MKPRVLVVDDSSYVRMSVSKGLIDQGFDVVGTARNGEEAIEKNLELEPDVILLDLQMPVMNGVEATRRIIASRPVPILVFASLEAHGAELAIQALAEGAYDVIAKGHRGDTPSDLAPHIWSIATRSIPSPQRSLRAERPELVVIASSTGGPPCVEAIVTSLAESFPMPVIIAQHMPAGFTHNLAARLSSLSAVHVMEAHDGMTVGPGDVAVLPGGRDSTISSAGAQRFTIHVGAGDGLPGAKPNASALFFSALGCAHERVLGIVLTGMGADASDAVRALVSAGATVIAQDPAEAVIPSMPNAAIQAGAQHKLRIAQIVQQMASLSERMEAS